MYDETLSFHHWNGGPRGIRTPISLFKRQDSTYLSYRPVNFLVRCVGFAPTTARLKGECYNLYELPARLWSHLTDLHGPLKFTKLLHRYLWLGGIKRLESAIFWTAFQPVVPTSKSYHTFVHVVHRNAAEGTSDLNTVCHDLDVKSRTFVRRAYDFLCWVRLRTPLETSDHLYQSVVSWVSSCH